MFHVLPHCINDPCPLLDLQFLSTHNFKLPFTKVMGTTDGNLVHDLSIYTISYTKGQVIINVCFCNDQKDILVNRSLYNIVMTGELTDF